MLNINARYYLLLLFKTRLFAEQCLANYLENDCFTKARPGGPVVGYPADLPKESWCRLLKTKQPLRINMHLFIFFIRFVHLGIYSILKKCSVYLIFEIYRGQFNGSFSIF